MDMQRTKHTAEFKAEAVKQVVDKGHAVVDVAGWDGHPHSGKADGHDSVDFGAALKQAHCDDGCGQSGLRVMKIGILR
jgi:hypothetical protein